MLWKKTLGLLLSLLIIFSLFAVCTSHNINGLNWLSNTITATPTLFNHILIFSSYQNLVFNEPPNILNDNATRAEIYNYIAKNPGVQFRGICNALGLAIGTIEFHLSILKKTSLISSLEDGRYKRFFPSKKYSKKEMKIIALLRHDTTRNILKTLNVEKTAAHTELASELSITSQGLTWQMKRLTKEGIVQATYDGLKVNYALNKKDLTLVAMLLCVLEQ